MAQGSKATITAKIGAGLQATAVVINNAQEIHVSARNGVLTVDGKDFDLTGVTAFTVTPSVNGTVYTVVIS